MHKPLSKPRWSSWEGVCVKAAFEQKIQLKVIAVALQKSVNSVSKKIKALGLRGRNAKPGRLKGEEYNSKWDERTSLDFAHMMEILKTYAPLSSLTRFPFPSPRVDLPRKIVHKNSAYLFLSPLSYTLLEEKAVALPGIEKGWDESILVPFCYVEKWAFLKGFQQVCPGKSYWRKGQYFSKVQVLIYLNELRLAKRLPPLSLYEEGECDHLQNRQKGPTHVRRARPRQKINGHKKRKINE